MAARPLATALPPRAVAAERSLQPPAVSAALRSAVAPRLAARAAPPARRHPPRKKWSVRPASPRPPNPAGRHLPPPPPPPRPPPPPPPRRHPCRRRQRRRMLAGDAVLAQRRSRAGASHLRCCWPVRWPPSSMTTAPSARPGHRGHRPPCRPPMRSPRRLPPPPRCRRTHPHTIRSRGTHCRERAQVATPHRPPWRPPKPADRRPHPPRHHTRRRGRRCARRHTGSSPSQQPDAASTRASASPQASPAPELAARHSPHRAAAMSRRAPFGDPDSAPQRHCSLASHRVTHSCYLPPMGTSSVSSAAACSRHHRYARRVLAAPLAAHERKMPWMALPPPHAWSPAWHRRRAEAVAAYPSDWQRQHSRLVGPLPLGLWWSRQPWLRPLPAVPFSTGAAGTALRASPARAALNPSRSPSREPRRRASLAAAGRCRRYELRRRGQTGRPARSPRARHRRRRRHRHLRSPRGWQPAHASASRGQAAWRTRGSNMAKPSSSRRTLDSRP